MRLLETTRRRFVAGLGALGFGVPAHVARAADCQVADYLGSYLEPQPVYRITARTAEFGIPIDIVAIGEDKITLFAPPEKGGIGRARHALLKGVFKRETPDVEARIDQIGFEWPLTVVRNGDKYNTIVGLAYEQKIPVGLVLKTGDTVLGRVVFNSEIYAHDASQYGFNGEAAAQVDAALMKGEQFVVELNAGGTVFSKVIVPANSYRDFVNKTVKTNMASIAAKDAAGGCEAPSSSDSYGGMPGCFLTSACCAVVGLPDDCWELSTLRRFRDGWMRRSAQGRADIARYYRDAPAIAASLMASDDGRRRLLRLYWTVILPCAAMIQVGINRPAHLLYRRMMAQQAAAPTRV